MPAPRKILGVFVPMPAPRKILGVFVPLPAALRILCVSGDMHTRSESNTGCYLGFGGVWIVVVGFSNDEKGSSIGFLDRRRIFVVDHWLMSGLVVGESGYLFENDADVIAVVVLILHGDLNVACSVDASPLQTEVGAMMDRHSRRKQASVRVKY
ncbi:hypothetical protein C8R45DRAFT_921395 [Mycena sanguinolenta]|nr:hypothetical protein C8R45DRAFT_921395 [Mycena sanguinolenta]